MSTIERMEGSTDPHPTVSREEWLAERVKLLAQEKEFTCRGTGSPPHGALPWIRVEKQYVFDCDETNWDIDNLICPDLTHRREIWNG